MASHNLEWQMILPNWRKTKEVNLNTQKQSCPQICQQCLEPVEFNKKVHTEVLHKVKKMSLSLCLSVSLCVCVCVSEHMSNDGETDQSSQIVCKGGESEEVNIKNLDDDCMIDVVI